LNLFHQFLAWIFLGLLKEAETERGLEEGRRKLADELTAEAIHKKHALESKASRLQSKLHQVKAVPDNLRQQAMDAQEEIRYWQNQATELKEQIDAFLEKEQLHTFEDGRYTDAIRYVYIELMCLQVGSRNVEQIVR
jgi:chromosome segregation ATPase